MPQSPGPSPLSWGDEKTLRTLFPAVASLRTSACVFTHRYSSARAFVDFFRAHFGLRYARSRPGRNGTCAISRLQPANEAS
ncbi:MAG: hypothetical protein KDK05_10660 [Candidatus Competibacteraceae bacterium]|nr:hypothetical protein [Candidatus Competibacteraceae bacterium]